MHLVILKIGIDFIVKKLNIFYEILDILIIELKMVYGDHGRKVLHPMTTANYLAIFPFKEFYSKLLHFRILMRTGAVLLAGYGYFAYKNG